MHSSFDLDIYRITKIFHHLGPRNAWWETHPFGAHAFPVHLLSRQGGIISLKDGIVQWRGQYRHKEVGTRIAQAPQVEALTLVTSGISKPVTILSTATLYAKTSKKSTNDKWWFLKS